MMYFVTEKKKKSHAPRVGKKSSGSIKISVTEHVGGNSLFVALIDSESVVIASLFFFFFFFVRPSIQYMSRA